MTPFSGAGISDLSNILARHANACIGVRGFFIIDTPIPSWIGLRDKKASGFIPVCALVPVFYVSHDICLTYIIIWVGRMAPVSEVRTQITGGSIPSLSTKRRRY